MREREKEKKRKEKKNLGQHLHFTTWREKNIEPGDGDNNDALLVNSNGDHPIVNIQFRNFFFFKVEENWAVGCGGPICPLGRWRNRSKKRRNSRVLLFFFFFFLLRARQVLVGRRRRSITQLVTTLVVAFPSIPHSCLISIYDYFIQTSTHFLFFCVCVCVWQSGCCRNASCATASPPPLLLLLPGY